jgi:RNA polymerase sigma factor (sigma-70 family)
LSQHRGHERPGAYPGQTKREGVTAMNPNWLKNYEQVIEPWKLHLALARMKAMRIRGQDLQDMMQELALPLIQFRYDPATADGATAETILCNTINSRLRQIRRARNRDQQRVIRRARWQGVTGDPDRDEKLTIYEEQFGLHLDVLEAMKTMPQFERSVCEGLMNGLSRYKIAQRLDCAWHTVRNAIKRIKVRLEEAGLGDWVIR